MPTRGEALEGAELQFEYPQRIQYWVVAELGYQAIDINLEVSPSAPSLDEKCYLRPGLLKKRSFNAGRSSRSADSSVVASEPTEGRLRRVQQKGSLSPKTPC